jgi:hypothetical protein
MLLEQIVVHARFVVEAVEETGGNELNQIAITFFVFREQDEMVGALGIASAILMIIRRDVNFAANDGLYAVRAGLMKEICRSEKISVISHRNCRHAPARRFGR